MGLTLLLFKVFNLIFEGLYLVLIVRVLISWFPHDRNHPILQFIYNVSDPMLAPFQNIIPSWKIGFDLSPIFAFIGLGIVRNLLFTLLF